MFDGEYCRVHIRVKAETQFGQVVGIGGSSFSLGYFNKSRAVLLVTTPESYPVWYTSSPLVLPRAQIFQYKYCIFENGICKNFENLEIARSFSPDSSDCLLEDVLAIEDIVGTDVENEIELLNGLHAMNSPSKESGSSKESPKGDSKLYIICYHLPVTVRRNDDRPCSFTINWADSLISKSENSVATTLETFWMGTVTVPGAPLTANEIDALRAQLLLMNCIPVFISPEVAASAYLGYCKQVMWPTFHNVDPLDHIHAAWRTAAVGRTGGLVWSGDSTQQWWCDYQKVNVEFSERLHPLLAEEDILWVHDYHLMLMPKLLRDRGIANSIVFFLHIPFPTSQVLPINRFDSVDLGCSEAFFIKFIYEGIRSSCCCVFICSTIFSFSTSTASVTFNCYIGRL